METKDVNTENTKLDNGSGVKRSGEYLEKGDYHKDPEKSWRYYPVYVEK